MRGTSRLAFFMKISLNWLRDYVDWNGDVSALAETLTFAGVEVEAIHQRGANFEKVVVAQILESVKHPKADRLSVCQVDDGTGKPRQIVCGAKNYNVGDKVPLALPGAVLPGDFKIKSGVLRDVESQGMLCSAKELNLAEDADGLLILPQSVQVGIPISDALPSDTTIEIEVTPNRPDLLSHVGLAREVATLEKLSFNPPGIFSALSEASAIGVQLATENCPAYTATRIDGVVIGPSPDWLRERLESVGLRPINNVVDVTNYVLLELGQPLHAFDADLLKGDIVVRQARKEETFLALDGKEYQLSPEDMVIADSERALAIAGVMGGEHTGVTGTTLNILLESAFFVPQAVRRTSRRLGLISDSSYRFERRVDPAGVLPAALRAAMLIQQVAGGRIVGFSSAGGVDTAPRRVSLRHTRSNAIIGAAVTPVRIAEILTGFGLTKVNSNDEASEWDVPSFRPDLEREIDLIEEICRVHGMDKIPSQQAGRFAPSSEVDLGYDAEQRIRQFLVGAGFSEIKTVTLISPQALEQSYFGGAGETVRIRNPLSEDQAVLRPSLSSGLLDVMSRNIRQGLRDLQLFEIGTVFGGEQEEMRKLGLLYTGNAMETTWRSQAVAGDFFVLKGVLEGLLGQKFELRPSAVKKLVPGFEIVLHKRVIGQIGQVSPAKARELDVRAPLILAELEIAAVSRARTGGGRIKPLPKYPAVTRDVAMVAPLQTTHAEIESVIRGAKEPLLIDLQLFDLFTDPTGAKVAADRKSMAYSFTYRAADRTLTAEEVNSAHEKLKKTLAGKVPVQFRE